jgi:hypothetical protein
VVEGLDGKAAKDKALGTLLTDGVAALDKSEGAVKWVDLSPGYKLATLKQIETTPFFQTVRGELVTGIYNNPAVWRHFAMRARRRSMAAISTAASTISAGWTKSRRAEHGGKIRFEQ